MLNCKLYIQIAENKQFIWIQSNGFSFFNSLWTYKWKQSFKYMSYHTRSHILQLSLLIICFGIMLINSSHDNLVNCNDIASPDAWSSFNLFSVSSSHLFCVHRTFTGSFNVNWESSLSRIILRRILIPDISCWTACFLTHLFKRELPDGSVYGSFNWD